MHGPTCIFWANLTPFSLQVLPWQQTLLFAAVEACNLAAVRYLLSDKVCDPNVRNGDAEQQQPLHAARARCLLLREMEACHGVFPGAAKLSEEICVVLEASGADKSAVDGRGSPPAELSTDSGSAKSWEWCAAGSGGQVWEKLPGQLATSLTVQVGRGMSECLMAYPGYGGVTTSFNFEDMSAALVDLDPSHPWGQNTVFLRCLELPNAVMLRPDCRWDWEWFNAAGSGWAAFEPAMSEKLNSKAWRTGTAGRPLQLRHGLYNEMWTIDLKALTFARAADAASTAAAEPEPEPVPSIAAAGAIRWRPVLEKMQENLLGEESDDEMDEDDATQLDVRARPDQETPADPDDTEPEMPPPPLIEAFSSMKFEIEQPDSEPEAGAAGKNASWSDVITSWMQEPVRLCDIVTFLRPTKPIATL